MYSYEWKCAWGDADPMGIAYYPRLVNAMHRAGEEFMVSKGVPYWDMPDNYGVFFPIVAMDMEFESTVEVGDVLDIVVEPDLGETSMGLDFTAKHQDGTVANTGREQHVCVSAEEHKPQPLPDELREILTEA